MTRLLGKCQDILKRLEALGTAQNRKVYCRHGVIDPMYGVSYSNLKKLQKEIKVHQGLAVDLWKSGNHDARVLASMIADPSHTPLRLLETWSRDLNNYVLTDAFSTLVAKTPLARKWVEKWLPSPKEWLGSSGWTVLAHLAMKETHLSDEYFIEHIHTIVSRIEKSPNRVKHAMNGALIAIGLRNDNLWEEALKAADRIGIVEVDHGETQCKTPDAATYIQRAKIRKQAAKKFHS